MPSRVDNPVVRAVERIPATMALKLLVAFVSTAILLVVVGLLGLRVIAESNGRVQTLGDLQVRATAYRGMQTYADLLHTMVGLRAGGSDASTWAGSTPLTPTSLAAIDEAIIASPLSRLENTTDLASLGFTPAPDELSSVRRIRDDYQQFSGAIQAILRLDQTATPSQATPQQGAIDALAYDLVDATGQLVTKTQDETATKIAENQSSYADSQRLFVAVAIGSVMLALLLGSILSWSLIGPIRRMQAQLAGIAAGDFSRHVDVTNRDELGTLAGNINHMNDELGRLYTELDAASRHKTEFLANMSHELRTPLNAIIGFSQVLREQMFGELNPRQAEYLDDILGSGQHLLNLINDILDLSKVEAGRMELQSSVFALAPIVENALVTVRERATREGIDLRSQIDPHVGEVEGDERKVKQILFNLLSNAVKFTPQGGRVVVGARPADGRVQIAVQDSGVGISAEDQGRIFDEFYQVATGRAHEGTGLGLALTRRLVELHGGKLEVMSAPGTGSTFTFSLPVSQTPADSNGATAGAGEPAVS